MAVECDGYKLASNVRQVLLELVAVRKIFTDKTLF